MAPGGSYEKGSVVEYNPPPWGRWMPALVAATIADKDEVTVEFVMMGVPHEHNVPCSSSRLAPLGVHEHGLPPGFWARPSKNRLGQLAYFDKVTGARYGTVELAWRVHLERVLRMEALPTVCDIHSDASCRFSWAGTLGVVANLGAVAPGRAAVSDGVSDGMLVEDKYDSGVCFSGNVFAELMAAPSPAAVPMSIFANIENAQGCIDENDIADNCQSMESSMVPSNPCHNALHAGAAVPEERIALEMMLSELKHGALPEERVAELEGALEASRDRVKELEANLGQRTLETKAIVPRDLGDDLSQAESVHSEADHAHPRCLEVSSQSHVAEWESVQSESGSVKENVSRLEEALSRIIAEENVLQKAVEIANLRRTADVLSGAHGALETREPHFAELLQEIGERQAQLLEVSQMYQKKEQDLDKLCLSLQAREQANRKFEEYLKVWEGQISTSKPVIKQSHPSMSVVGTPPKLPKAKPRALLPSSCARMSPRSGYRSVPMPARAGGVAGRAAAAAAAMTMAAVAARGVPAPHSVSVASSRAASPQSGRGFQTPRRSLSPATTTPDLHFRGRRGSAPATPDLRCRRASHGGSLSVCSMRSGSSTTAASSSPESCIVVPAQSQQLIQESTQVQHYTGVITHPLYGSEEIPIDVTLLSRSEGLWNAVHQNEQISVKWDAKHILMSDKTGATTLDGQEVLGGMLIGAVTQNGMPGGRFRLNPCPKLQVCHALLKRTCIRRAVQMVPAAVVSRSPKLAVQPLVEVGWRTSYQVAFA